MLVAAKVHGPGVSDEFERAAAWRLRPAVAIEASEETVVSVERGSVIVKYR